MLKSSRSDSKLTQEPQIINKFGPDPKLVNCQNCKKEVLTVVEINFTDNNNCIGSILCILGFWPCGLYMCICAEGVSDLNHYCPICENQLGTIHILREHIFRTFAPPPRMCFELGFYADIS